MTLNSELVIYLTSSEEKDKDKEVVTMLEFMMMLGIMSLVFLAVSIVIAVLSAGLLRVGKFLAKKTVTVVA